MTPLIVGILAASLAGSPHCVGMCGAFAWMAAPGAAPRRAVLAYHLARLAGYATLGAVAGTLGGAAGRLGALAGAGRAAAVVAGALMIAGGTAALLVALGVRVPLPRTNAGGAMLAVATRARNARPLARAIALGAVTALLPCGLLYAFVATAAASGGAVPGAGIMLLFGAGTLPAFALLAGAARRAAGPLARRLPLVTAAALIIVGLLTMFGRMPAPGAMHHLSGSCRGAPCVPPGRTQGPPLQVS